MPPIPLPHLRPRATGGAVPPIDRRQRARRMPTRRIPQPLVSLLPRRRKCIQKGTVSVPAIRPQARKRNRPAFASGDHRALTSAQSAHCAAYSRTSRCVEGWLRSSGLLLIWRTSGRSCLGNLVSIFRIEEATQTGPLLPTARFRTFSISSRSCGHILLRSSERLSNNEVGALWHWPSIFPSHQAK
jgi:hypothetical protein